MAMLFPVGMYGYKELDHKEGRVPRKESMKELQESNWHWRRLLRVPVGCRVIKLVSLRGSQP